jgi:hypothetical protein
VIDLLDVQETDTVLEVGFGPGVAIQLLAGSALHVAGRRSLDGNAAAGEQAQCRGNSRGPRRSGLREIWRVLKPDGTVALAFTAYSGQRSEGVTNIVAAAGFFDCRLVETDQAFCVIAARR